MQLKFTNLLKESANTLALREGFRMHSPIGRKRGLKDFPIASGKAEYTQGAGRFIGYRNSRGRIYLLCPFHREKTPSCVVFFKGDGGPDHPSRWTHYSCFGCKKFGSIRELCHGLRTLPRDKLVRGWPLLDDLHARELRSEGFDPDIPF